MQTKGKKQKIAILGGGIGSLSAAFELTDDPGWHERFEITIYQMGWRLGGKGASGRGVNGRIEEHGMHMWFGFYHNAFDLMQRCYAAWKPSKPTKITTWTDAFSPHDTVVFQEHIDGSWRHWPMKLPRNHATPGIKHGIPRIRNLTGMVISTLMAIPRPDASVNKNIRGLHWIECIVWLACILGFFLLSLPIQLCYRRSQALNGSMAHPPRWMQRIEAFIETRDSMRRLWVLLNLSSAIVRGFILDKVFLYGVHVIDKYEFKDWLKRHGATDLTLKTTLLRGLYDMTFFYRDANPDTPDCAAGVGLTTMLRLFFTFKGAILYLMQAGMGEVVFVPLYEVLRARGVQFSFFHCVEKLHLSADQKSIDRIDIGIQATPKDTQYEPLTYVNGLLCWPSNPHYDQLCEGELLKTQSINLESSWTDWQPVDRISLTVGHDFDKVVLGIPVSALYDICEPLRTADPRWDKMFKHLKTVQTQAAQVWFTPEVTQVGDTFSIPMLTGYVHPLPGIVNMTHVVKHENWGTSKQPGLLLYICGALSDEAIIPDSNDLAFPERQRERVKHSLSMLLDSYARHILPAAQNAQDPNCFNWDVLFDPHERSGIKRLDAQYFRANIDLSERYLLSVTGSVEYRLKSTEAGFSNLLLAGDWTYTGFILSCIETATMSGKQAARALLGRRLVIPGEHCSGLLRLGNSDHRLPRFDLP